MKGKASVKAKGGSLLEEEACEHLRLKMSQVGLRKEDKSKKKTTNMKMKHRELPSGEEIFSETREASALTASSEGFFSKGATSDKRTPMDYSHR